MAGTSKMSSFRSLVVVAGCQLRSLLFSSIWPFILKGLFLHSFQIEYLQLLYMVVGFQMSETESASPLKY